MHNCMIIIAKNTDVVNPFEAIAVLGQPQLAESFQSTEEARSSRSETQRENVAQSTRLPGCTMSRTQEPHP